MKKNKEIEFNFGVFVILLVILLVAVFAIARYTGNGIGENGNKSENIAEENQANQEKKEKLFSKNVITIDEGQLNENWKIVDKEYGSIIFYAQGPKRENEDGTVNDIRINIYVQKSEMTNEELKTQMLEDSIYQEIQYTKMQQIDSIQWMEFEAKNKGVKAKILTIMKDGYMYAAEICGEEKIYDENYNDAMRAVMTIQIAERVNVDDAYNVIVKYDNLANIKEGGTQYLLTSLNLPKTIEQIEENSTLPEEYKDYKWTGINYNDFINEMKKYMTEDVIKAKFSEFINYKDCLFVKEVNGEQTEYMIEDIKITNIKGNETTFEVVKDNITLYQTQKQNITVKLDNGNLVVSNVE